MSSEGTDISGQQRGAVGAGAEQGLRGSEAALTRHEEELVVGKETHEVGRVRAVKHVESRLAATEVPRDVEHADMERVSVSSQDSGQVEQLPDGSVSIPVFEEELVVTKRLVVRERIVIRKRVVTEQQRVEAELRRERIDVEGDVDNPEALLDPR